ncbi:hypothetical protein M8C13_30075 [Crossiella sp. SN42]|uniref:hypothetical protein n=1 Tax=Crossiella sp. SN42 TaxID=2944808 RepID=UPI00207D5C0A|nr:hypothetical protein [Crossiella sp. SN42]MCO1580009.1 hypothetical protein [Crossiella sp. SN42]
MTVDQSGLVVDVTIVERWRDSVPPRELGELLRTTANTALLERVTAQLAEGAPRPSGPAQPAAALGDAGGDPAGVVARGLKQELQHLLARFDTELEQYRAELTKAAQTPTTGVAANGVVSVSLGGNGFTAVELEPAWLHTARHTEIRVTVLSAFQDAQRRTAHAAIAPPASVARLVELGSDPQALLRALGLGG